MAKVVNNSRICKATIFVGLVEVIDLRPMSYHDRDVTAYQIAVIIKNR